MLLAALVGCAGALEPKQARFEIPPCPEIGFGAAPAGEWPAGEWQVRPEPVLDPGAEGAWDSVDVLNPSVVRVHGLFYNLYSGFDGGTWRTGLATSTDGVVWEKDSGRAVLSPDPAGWEGDYIAANGSLVHDGGQFLYWYQAGPRGRTRIGLARSPDARSWTKIERPVLDYGPAGAWDEAGLGDPSVVACGDAFYLFYLGQNRGGVQRLGVARSRDGVHWRKSHLNPLLEPGGADEFDAGGLGEPALVWAEGFFWMLYTGRDAQENRRLGWARSPDGVRWRKAPGRGAPSGARPWNSAVFCDPSLMSVEGKLWMWFGGGDRPSPDENLNGRIGLAVLEAGSDSSPVTSKAPETNVTNR